MGAVTGQLWPSFTGPGSSRSSSAFRSANAACRSAPTSSCAERPSCGPTAGPCRCCQTPSTTRRRRTDPSPSWRPTPHRAATVLSDLGISRSDAVAVISVNCAEMLPLLLAAEAVGIFAPINPGLTAEHAQELVRLSGAKVIVAAGPELDAAIWADARAIARDTGARALLALRPTAPDGEPPKLDGPDGVEVAYLADRMAGANATELPGDPPSAGDIASYLHTGGTTGTPKLAARTHANEVSNAWMIRASNVLDEDSVIFAALPLFHTNALVVTVLAPLLKGQHVVWGGPLGYRDTALFPNFWKIVERYQISAMSAVPTVYSVLAQTAVDADISSLRLPIVGAAALAPAVRDTFHACTGIVLCEGYGLTEGTCASALSWPGAARPGSVGQRLPYQEARAVAVDEATGEWTFLPENEIGTLVLRGPNIFAGYLARGSSGPEFRAEGKIKDGWLDTGDLASVDAEGFIRLAGRAKDLIIRGGHNIDPATIEDALLAHPDVTAAAAVGRPDPHAGEVPVAFVTITSGTARSAHRAQPLGDRQRARASGGTQARRDPRGTPADLGGQAIQAGAATPSR